MDPEDFVRQHHRLALFHANRFVHLAAGDEDAVVSDAMLGLWQAATTWTEDSGISASAYLRTRVEARVIDGLRSRLGETRRRTRPTLVELTEVTREPSHRDHAEDVAEREDVERALAHLDARTRRAVHAYYWQGRTLCDIAGELGLTEGRISQLLTAARAALRPRLAVAA